MYVPGNAISSFFINFLIPIGRILLPRNPVNIMAIIIDFAYRESSRGIFSFIIVFAILLIIFSFYVDIYVNIIPKRQFEEPSPNPTLQAK